jgi:ubiquinone/menaquinone biosynthesis C-methylase UbiE
MLAAEELKACCAAAYSSEAARWLLGDSLHPGGAALTRQLVRSLGVGPRDLVVDVGSGLGTSAIQLFSETGCDVVGIDLAGDSVTHATAAAERAGASAHVRFVLGDAEALPLPDGSADGALCECALCIFPDKELAAAELARVLRPGARLALSDVTADSRYLPAELRSTAAWTACVAGACRLEEIAAVLERAGLAVEATERHDDALADLIERIGARLRILGLRPEIVAAARRAVDEGALGYAAVIARRP